MDLTEDLQNAVNNFLNGDATTAEVLLVSNWYNGFDDTVIRLPLDQNLREKVKLRMQETLVLRINNEATMVAEEEDPSIKINKAMNAKKTFGTRARILLIGRVAAAVLIVAGAWWLLAINHQEQPQIIAHTPGNTTGIAAQQDNRPGDKVLLTLSDGTVMALEGLKENEIAAGSATNIAKIDQGVLEYKTNGTATTSTEPVYNTISTPRGGLYQILLPDGTRVWLNSLTELTYPIAFTGTERKVFLKGEAYFEVKSDKNKPFLVVIDDAVVHVLGTAFNLKSYPEEHNKSATVINGAIKMVQLKGAAMLESKVLKASEALELREGSFNYQDNVNIAETIAWKNGQFQFTNVPIERIMQEAGRWYDIEVEYEGSTNELFSGSIPRTVEAHTFFEVFESTGYVKFEIKNKQVKVKLK